MGRMMLVTALLAVGVLVLLVSRASPGWIEDYLLGWRGAQG